MISPWLFVSAAAGISSIAYRTISRMPRRGNARPGVQHNRNLLPPPQKGWRGSRSRRALVDPLRHGRVERALEFAVDVERLLIGEGDELHQDDARHPLRRIDPEVGVGETGPGQAAGAAAAGNALGADHEARAPFFDHAGEELGIVREGRRCRLEQTDVEVPHLVLPHQRDGLGLPHLPAVRDRPPPPIWNSGAYGVSKGIGSSAQPGWRACMPTSRARALSLSLNAVSFMPSGPNRFSPKYVPSVWPLTRSTALPIQSMLMP